MRQLPVTKVPDVHAGAEGGEEIKSTESNWGKCCRLYAEFSSYTDANRIE